MPVPGFDTYIVDEPVSGASATATDTLYLLSTAGPATPTPKTKADTGDATLDAYLSAFFAVAGRGSSVVVQGVGDGTTLPLPTTALGLLPPGPGQVVAPEQVTSAALIPLLAAWNQNKILFANGASGLTDAQLATLSAALIAGGDGRGAALFADYYQFPQVDGSGTDNIPAALTAASCCRASSARHCGGWPCCRARRRVDEVDQRPHAVRRQDQDRAGALPAARPADVRIGWGGGRLGPDRRRRAGP